MVSKVWRQSIEVQPRPMQVQRLQQLGRLLADGLSWSDLRPALAVLRDEHEAGVRRVLRLGRFASTARSALTVSGQRAARRLDAGLRPRERHPPPARSRAERGSVPHIGVAEAAVNAQEDHRLELRRRPWRSSSAIRRPRTCAAPSRPAPCAALFRRALKRGRSGWACRSRPASKAYLNTVRTRWISLPRATGPRVFASRPGAGRSRRPPGHRPAASGRSTRRSARTCA